MAKRLRDKRDGSLWTWDAQLAKRPEFETIDVFVDTDKVLPKPAPSAGKETVAMHTLAMGIGDAICALYAVCGYANTGRKVVFHTRHIEWLKNVSHPGVEIRPHRETDVNVNQDYGLQLKASNEIASRATWYCKNISEFLLVPPFDPARPEQVSKPDRIIEDKYVVVCPSSASKDREWRAVHWVRLAIQLQDRVVVLGSTEDKDRLTKLFDGTNAEVRCGSAQEAVSIIAHASHVYGNDSGLTHLAGLFGVPTTAVMSQLSPSFVFKEAPSVKGVAPDESVNCRFCAWQPDRGFRPACRTECSALSEIKVSDVLQTKRTLTLPKKERQTKRLTTQETFSPD